MFKAYDFHAYEIAQWVKTLADNTEDLSSIHKIDMVERQVVLWTLNKLYGTYEYPPVINKWKNT